jgi:hypothetical protein
MDGGVLSVSEDTVHGAGQAGALNRKTGGDLILFVVARAVGEAGAADPNPMTERP